MTNAFNLVNNYVPIPLGRRLKKTVYTFKFRLASISNHMANSVNWLKLIKENMAASALIDGM
jgi:hypothetical protein